MKSIQEFVETNRDHPLKISVFESSKLKYPFHYHASEYELTLTLGSSGLRLVGDSMREFGNTDLVVIGPGIPHCWLNNFTNGVENPENIKVVVIHFNDHVFSEELLKRQELNHIRNLLLSAGRGIVFYGSIREKIKHEILKLKIDPDFGTWISLYAIFNELSQTGEYNYLTSLRYHYEGKKEEKVNFEKVHAFILDNFRDKIKIGKVASLIGMNESAFSHYFKKRTLKSYTDFINELRLNYAANQLSHTPKNVSEIASESGFSNLSNFNRMFKKWKDMTPNQWRKMTENDM
ncbi:MAG: helix-turn-helix domain-containing protein [Cyclobacteriaceae bacterium]|nr:helix-turn-helix domain-containing protein [Cyclobacteriaceae bacterium]